jgi:hypothetical protein
MNIFRAINEKKQVNEQHIALTKNKNHSYMFRLFVYSNLQGAALLKRRIQLCYTGLLKMTVGVLTTCHIQCT